MMMLLRSLSLLLLSITLSACNGGGGGNKQPAVNSDTVTRNHAPIAKAGDDRVVTELTQVTLNGSDSLDPDGDAITFLWSQVSGPNAVLSSPSSPAPTLVAPNAGQSLVFQLIVNDGTTVSTADTVQLTTVPAPINQPPVARVGANQSIHIGQLVVLDGAQSSDPDGDTLRYVWSQTSGSAVALSSTTAINPTFTAPGTADTLTFALTVYDPQTSSAPATTTVTVNALDLNNAPIANAGIDQTVAGGSVVLLSGNNSRDPDGDPLTYQWQQTGGPNVLLSSANAAVAAFPSPATGGVFTFALVVSDGQLQSASDSVTITVNPVNQAPIANAGNDQSVSGDTVVVISGTSSHDPEGDALSYRWQQTSGPLVALSSITSAITGFAAPTTGGTLVFSLTVNDGQHDSASDSVTITVQPLNRAPIANAGADQTVAAGILVVLDGFGSRDADGDTLSYRWQQTGGQNVQLTSVVTAATAFSAPSTAGILTFALVVNDGKIDSLSDTVNVTIQASNTVNRAPVANAGIDQTVAINSNVTLDGYTSQDPDGDGLSYRWLQTGGQSVTLSSATVASPSFTSPGNDSLLTFSLIVNDGLLDSAADTVQISVVSANLPPLANAGSDRYVSSNAQVTLTGLASQDPDGNPLTYLWTQLSGPVLTLSSYTNAQPSFTASVDGELVFSLVVNDGLSDSNADTVTVFVGAIAVSNSKVNGTGITWGGNYPSGNNTTCIGETVAQQDCSYGRNLRANDDSDGRAGFSYTKISAQGVELPASAETWDCVKDNVTGLIWEVKKGGNGIKGDEGLHDADDVFKWYNTDIGRNGGANGYDNLDGSVCSSYSAGDANSYCNTQAYVARVNSEATCGFSNWRMPSSTELLSLIDFGRTTPMIDLDYFPAGGVFVWSDTALALGTTSAWGVFFDSGRLASTHRNNARQVRLVRSAP